MLLKFTECNSASETPSFHGRNGAGREKERQRQREREEEEMKFVTRGDSMFTVVVVKFAFVVRVADIFRIARTSVSFYQISSNVSPLRNVI